MKTSEAKEGIQESSDKEKLNEKAHFGQYFFDICSCYQETESILQQFNIVKKV